MKDEEDKRFLKCVRRKCNMEAGKDHYHHGFWKRILPCIHRNQEKVHTVVMESEQRLSDGDAGGEM